MHWREFLKPHEAELLEAAEHNLKCAQETAEATRRLIRDRCRKRRDKEIKEAA